MRGINLYIIAAIALGLSGCICDTNGTVSPHASDDDDDDSELDRSFTHPDVLRADIKRFGENLRRNAPAARSTENSLPELTVTTKSVSHDEVITTLDEVNEPQFRPLSRTEFVKKSTSTDNTDTSTQNDSVSNSFKFSGLHKALSEARTPLASQESVSTLIDTDLDTSNTTEIDTPEIIRSRTYSVAPIPIRSPSVSSPLLVQSAKSYHHSIASSYRERRMSLEDMIAAGIFEPKSRDSPDLRKSTMTPASVKKIAPQAHPGAEVHETVTTPSPDDESNGHESDDDILFDIELPTTH